MKLRHAVYAVGLALALIGISKPVSADTLPAYDITADIPASNQSMTRTTCHRLI
ncbi:MAG TPA: hypothetical protein K8V66_07970 [Weissella confusa]|nr:hypothetical protein [Weissella confusa]